MHFHEIFLQESAIAECRCQSREIRLPSRDKLDAARVKLRGRGETCGKSPRCGDKNRRRRVLEGTEGPHAEHVLPRPCCARAGTGEEMYRLAAKKDGKIVLQAFRRTFVTRDNQNLPLQMVTQPRRDTGKKRPRHTGYRYRSRFRRKEFLEGGKFLNILSQLLHTISMRTIHRMNRPLPGNKRSPPLQRPAMSLLVAPEGFCEPLLNVPRRLYGPGGTAPLTNPSASSIRLRASSAETLARAMTIAVFTCPPALSSNSSALL